MWKGISSLLIFILDEINELNFTFKILTKGLLTRIYRSKWSFRKDKKSVGRRSTTLSYYLGAPKKYYQLVLLIHFTTNLKTLSFFYSRSRSYLFSGRRVRNTCKYSRSEQSEDTRREASIDQVTGMIATTRNMHSLRNWIIFKPIWLTN